MASMKVAGPYMLTIQLRERSALLLDDLETPITKLAANGSPIGTGPYIVTSSSDDEVVMEAFPRYYRSKPSIERIVWRPYPTVRTAWAATMRGEVDFLYEVGPESREFLQLERSVDLFSFLRNYVYGLVFNSRRPMFHNREIRRALNYAVDRPAIVERAFRGHATVANGPTWPLHWANDPGAPIYAYDPSRAAASIEKVTVNSGGASHLRFTCLIPENFQLWERLALMVQRDLAKIGVNMALEAVPFDEFNDRIAKGDFDAVLTEMISGFSVSRPLSFWHSSGLHNVAGYRNTSVDAALESIRRAASENEYREAFQRFQHAILEDPPAVFIAWGQTARAVSRRFNAVRSDFGDIRTTIGDWRLAEPFVRPPN
jgi:peptide/nickel transport system substrate-binding protein